MSTNQYPIKLKVLIHIKFDIFPYISFFHKKLYFIIIII